MELCFRPLTEEDLDEVYEIEIASFSDPWQRDFFAMDALHETFVVQEDRHIIGYICTMQVLDECTITNLAVKPDFRRQGIAKFIFDEFFKTMKNRDIRFYYLEVRASNKAAISLYQKLGFQQVGIRKEYYNNPVEDAVVMAFDTGEK